MKFTLDAIEARIVDEALADPECGWLSDLALDNSLGYNEERGAIELRWGGSIDVAHLASLVSGMIREAQGE